MRRANKAKPAKQAIKPQFLNIHCPNLASIDHHVDPCKWLKYLVPDWEYISGDIARTWLRSSDESFEYDKDKNMGPVLYKTVK